VSAFVLDLLICRPCAGVVDLSAFVPEMWLSTFVSTFFLQVLETSPCRGGAAEIFNFSLQFGLEQVHFWPSNSYPSLVLTIESQN
jgi:hypothetical protein